MWLEHLQGWMVAATREKDPDTGHWDQVVDLFHMVFRDGLLSAECTWHMVVILTKVYGYLWGIIISLSLSLSNRPPGSPIVLIIGCWCSNPGA